MAIFEIEGPDGRIYEVDAASEDEALAAFEGFIPDAPESSNTPVTEEGGSFMDRVPAWMQQQANDKLARDSQFEREVLDSTGVAVSSFGNALTGGLYGAAGTGLDTLRRAAVEPSDSEMTLRDHYNASQFAQENARGAAPIADVGGTVLGAATGGYGAVKSLDDLARAGVPFAKKLTETLGGRVAAGAGLGAVQNAGIDAGQGGIDDFGDLAGSSAWGAAGGALGQLAGEGLAAGGRYLAQRFDLPFGMSESVRNNTALKDAHGMLTEKATGPGSIAAVVGQGEAVPASTYTDLAATMTDDAGNFFGNASDDLRQLTEVFAGLPSTTGATSGVRNSAVTRGKEAADTARNVLIQNLDGIVDIPRTPKNSEQFKAIFNTPEAMKVEVVSKQAIAGGLTRQTTAAGTPLLDPINRKGASDRLVNRLLEEMDNVTGRDGLTLNGLQNLKQSLDDAAASAWTGADSAQTKLSATEMSSLRGYVNDMLKSVAPEYADAAAQFSVHAREGKLLDMGRDMMRGTVAKYPTERVRELMATLDPDEALRVKQGAAEFIRGQSAKTPSYVRNLAKENPDLLERMDIILGDHFASAGTTVQEIAEAAGKQLDLADQFGRIAKASKNQARNAPGPSIEERTAIRNRIDLASPLLRISAGEGIASPLVNSARRLADQTPARTQRAIMELLSAAPSRVPTLIKAMEEAANLPNAGLSGGVTGSTLTNALRSLLER